LQATEPGTCSVIAKLAAEKYLELYRHRHGLPVIVDGDILRDEGESYADKLSQAGAILKSWWHKLRKHMQAPVENGTETKGLVPRPLVSGMGASFRGLCFLDLLFEAMNSGFRNAGFFGYLPKRQTVIQEGGDTG
jgi:hypothetical protein